MDPRPADYLRHRLKRFAGAIEETRDQFPDLSPFGRYPASAPYYERSGIRVLLDSIKEEPGTAGELLQEFQRLDTRLESLEQELGKEYRHRLLAELSDCMNRYHASVCHADLGSLNFENDHDLFCRDRIAVLIRELEKDHDLSEEKGLLRMLDHNLFCEEETLEEERFADSCGRTGKTHSRSKRDKIES
jgi:hypothetical protein